MSLRLSVKAQVGGLPLDVYLDGPAAPLCLVGPNGSGKTSLLRIIAGARRPDWGEIEVGGRCLFSSSLGIDLPSERRRVGYVPQGFGLFPHLRTIDNVAFGLVHGPEPRRTPEARAQALNVLARLEVDHLAARYPHTLSGGERQRVALARALAVEPQLVLLDEPLSSLDVSARRSVRRFLSEHLRALDIPSVIVTHDVRDVAALDAPLCVLEAGRVSQSGDLWSLQRQPQTDFVAELVEGLTAGRHDHG